MPLWCGRAQRSVYLPLSSEFQETQIASASLRPMLSMAAPHLFDASSDFPQSIERLAHAERAAAAEQTTDVAHTAIEQTQV